MTGDNWISPTLCNSNAAWRTSLSLRFLLDFPPPSRVMKRPRLSRAVSDTGAAVTTQPNTVTYDTYKTHRADDDKGLLTVLG